MLTVAFDVDGTLIGQNYYNEDTPQYDVINLLHLLQKFDCKIIIWSGGGVDYAKRWTEKLGLKATVLEKGSVPVDIAVDDMAVELGTVNLQIKTRISK